MKIRWQSEKAGIQAIRSLKEQLEQARIEEQQAERDGDLSRVAESVTVGSTIWKSRSKTPTSS